MRGDFALRDRGRHGPGRVEDDAGDLGGQRRRRLFGLADDDAIAPHHLVVLDRLGKGRGDIHHHIALAEGKFMLAEALQRSFELLDALVDGDVERGQRPRRHRSGRRQAMARLEALDGFGERVVVGAGRLVGGKIAAHDQALAQQIVMRSLCARVRIWRRKESPASRRAPRYRSSSARRPGSAARCPRRRSGHAAAPAPPPSAIPALTRQPPVLPVPHAAASAPRGLAGCGAVPVAAAPDRLANAGPPQASRPWQRSSFSACLISLG